MGQVGDLAMASIGRGVCTASFRESRLSATLIGWRCGAPVVLFCLVGAPWHLLDRIAVVVEGHVITRSDVYNEIRVIDFEKGDKLDLGLAAQKHAAKLLIDSAILRDELLVESDTAADSRARQAIMQQLRQRYPTEGAYRGALKSYGITQRMVENHVRRQLAVFQFIKLRFGNLNATLPSPAALASGGQDSVAFVNWIDGLRKQAQIVFEMKNLK